jgi:hypothetical protein
VGPTSTAIPSYFPLSARQCYLPPEALSRWAVLAAAGFLRFRHRHLPPERPTDRNDKRRKWVVIMDDSNPEQRIYLRLAALLREEITNGLLAPGSPVLSITSLCKVRDCSRRTGGHALQTLESEGLVYRVPGRGYFIAVHHRNHDE